MFTAVDLIRYYNINSVPCQVKSYKMKIKLLQCIFYLTFVYEYVIMCV
jgi:hypothetical protein